MCSPSYTEKYTEHRELVVKVGAGDMEFVEKRISDHVTKKDPLASLRSRWGRSEHFNYIIITSLHIQVCARQHSTAYCIITRVSNSIRSKVHPYISQLLC